VSAFHPEPGPWRHSCFFTVNWLDRDLELEGVVRAASAHGSVGLNADEVRFRAAKGLYGGWSAGGWPGCMALGCG